MAIDPSIPLQVRTLADFVGQNQQNRMRSAQMEDYQRKQQAEQEKRAALSDLIATRTPQGTYDTSGDAFKRYTQADPDGAFELLGKMDEQKRAAVESGLKDMASAVQWADTPEKWAQVQQHYGQFDPQLASIPFERRDQSLMKIGQLGEYLKATAPKIMSIEDGGSLAAVDPRTGRPTFTVLPNPGDQAPGASVGAAPPSAGITTKNVGGKTYYGVGGKWFDNEAEARGAGGQTASPSGPFRQ